jgi:hypothetical protein
MFEICCGDKFADTDAAIEHIWSQLTEACSLDEIWEMLVASDDTEG